MITDRCPFYGLLPAYNPSAAGRMFRDSHKFRYFSKVWMFMMSARACHPKRFDVSVVNFIRDS
jgi:hypothetical protein